MNEWRFYLLLLVALLVAVVIKAQDIVIEGGDDNISSTEEQSNFFNIQTGISKPPTENQHVQQQKRGGHSRSIINHAVNPHRRSRSTKNNFEQPSSQPIVLPQRFQLEHGSEKAKQEYQKLSYLLETENIKPDYKPTYFPIDPVEQQPESPENKDSTQETIQIEKSNEIQPSKRLKRRLMNLINQNPPGPEKVVETEIKSVESTATGCDCTNDGRSGDTSVPYSGCARHVEGHPAFCYVKIPNECKEFSRQSNEFPGASWKFCEAAPIPEPQLFGRPKTKIHQTEEDGVKTYTMKHSGIKTTLVTEGNKTLTPEEAKKKNDDMLKQVRKDQLDQKNNITLSVNETRKLAESSVKNAYESIESTLGDVMNVVDKTIKEAMSNDDSSSSSQNIISTKTLSYDSMFDSIQKRIAARTQQLTPSEPTSSNSSSSTTGPETKELKQQHIFDRLMGLSDKILHHVDEKMKAASEKAAQKAKNADSPVSVSASMDN